jgi:hypothetical protein
MQMTLNLAKPDMWASLPNASFLHGLNPHPSQLVQEGCGHIVAALLLKHAAQLGAQGKGQGRGHCVADLQGRGGINKAGWLAIASAHRCPCMKHDLAQLNVLVTLQPRVEVAPCVAHTSAAPVLWASLTGG